MREHAAERVRVHANGGIDSVAETVPLAVHLPVELLSAIFTFAALDDSSYPTLVATALVSKLWNTCATPILYRDLTLGEWDYRYVTTLLPTLAARPSLLEHVRSLSVCYPRLDAWRGNFYEDTFEPELRQRIEDGLRARRPGYVWDPAELAQDVGAELESDPEELINVVVQEAYAAKRADVRRAGVGPWMDAGGEMAESSGGGEDDYLDGEARRRAGAIELIGLIGRCPRLTSLSLEQFDFGDDGDRPGLGDLALLSLPPLPNLRVLSTRLDTTPDSTHFLLRLAPNLERLHTSRCRMTAGYEETDQSSCGPTTLDYLHDLHIDLSVMSTTTLARIVQLASKSLRFVNVDGRSPPDLCRLLLKLPNLESLTIDSPDIDFEGSTPADNCDLLTAATSLGALHTTYYLLPIPLIHSLPSSIVTLSGLVGLGNLPDTQSWPTADVWPQLREQVDALIVSKRRRTPVLELVTLSTPRRFGSEVAAKLDDQLTSARSVGLEIVLKLI